MPTRLNETFQVLILPGNELLMRQVNYPGLPSHPGHAVHAAQASSGGSLLSFETGRHCSFPLSLHIGSDGRAAGPETLNIPPRS